MPQTRVFKSGNSQAVRLPKEFRVDCEELEIFRRGDEIVLRPPRNNLAAAYDALAGIGDDFFDEGREDPPPQDREPL